MFAEGWRLVEAHRRRGHTVVIATSALPFQVEPLARELGIEHVLCTRLESEDGLLTGKVDGPILWGPGKAKAVTEFARAQKLDLGRSWGYGNGDEDEQFLSLVGHPRPLNPAKGLTRIAREHDWPVTRFSRRGRPGLTEAARTIAAYGGMLTAFGAGLGIGLFNRNRQDAVNFTMATGSDAALALAGVELDVTGEEHLWSHRPAVFIFNHQSAVDVLVAKLLRRDFTGIAKQEIRGNPVFGPAFAFAGWSSSTAPTAPAVDALKPAVEKLAEGARSRSRPKARARARSARRFKKGAFHLAMQAGVPIVPIVFENALDLFSRGATFMRPANVRAVVLPPDRTAGWTRESLDAESRRSASSSSTCWATGERHPRARGGRDGRARDQRPPRREGRALRGRCGCCARGGLVGHDGGVAGQPQRAAVLWARRRDARAR